MTTYQEQLTSAVSEDVIPPYWLGYFRELFRETINDQLLELYQAAAIHSGLTKKDIARKLGKRPEQITRWLAAPNNLEIDTVSDLALAMGCAPVFGLEKATVLPEGQQVHPLAEKMEAEQSEEGGVKIDWIETPSSSASLPEGWHLVLESAGAE